MPAVPAGQFRIDATQTICGVEDGGQLLSAVRLFEVKAPQFQLPYGTVHAVSPAPEAVGDLGLALAHVTLEGRILPWQRTIDPGELDTGPIEARPPWLALLVFAAGELSGDPHATGATDAMTVSDLLWPAGPAVGEIRPAIPRNQVPESSAAAECRTLRVPGAVFAAVCPREDELRHLAHVRTVCERSSEGFGEEPAEGDFSVLISGRLPDPAGGRHVVHLVSLEGCRDALEYAASGGTDERDVRLVSLHHWSFESLDGGAGFVQRVHDLLFDDEAEGVARDLLLRIPVPGPAGGAGPGEAGTGPDDEARQRAVDRLAQGWVPLPYQVDSGEETYSWYRGPFAAAPAQKMPEPPEGGWMTTGGLLVYDPEWAVFDTGWAAAWTVGRALALADDDFAARLGSWRDRARLRAAELVQRLAAAPAQSDAAALLGPRPRARALRERVEDGSVERVIRALSEARAGQEPLRSGGSLTADLTQTGVPPRQEPLHRVLAEALTGPGTAAGPHAQRLTALRTALREALAEDGEQPLADWFARLRLLHGVPFAYLVPSEAMLPPESLRFFHVDAGWLAALQAGAESLGASGEADRALAAFAGPWRRSSAAADGPCRHAGMLIRSALTRECPDLRIRAWQGKEAVGLLRRDLLEGDVLLVLFDRVPDMVELSEPPEGLSFGADPHPVDGTPVLNLRSLGGEVPPGETLEGAHFPQEPGEEGILAYLRPDPDGRRVLDLRPAAPDGLLGALATRLREAGELPHGPLAPSPFALQLLNAPYRQLILTPPLDRTPPSGAGHE
ncbi:hypothetical protein [Streptomyces noursei]|uniref:hypothetical protein n=1 Tax=Streptomyces noursei TaxID=1971 RepID=UPI001963A3BB|nr:hypothetical protein [Streptomyces noursei]QRX89945.1 hypothetical protein JNO44_02890 [Streptomyces noursei]